MNTDTKTHRNLCPKQKRVFLLMARILLIIVFAERLPAASAQGAPPMPGAVGILRILFKIGAGVASEQAIKTATEEAVKRGVPLPTEQYDLRSGLCYYNERTYGTYVWSAWPSRDFSCWVDPGSNVRYKLLINGDVVSTDPDYFEEQVRSYHCSPSPGNDWHLVTTMKYRPQCVVVTPNMAHAVNVHPATIFWSGPRRPSNCNDAPAVSCSESRNASIGRGSYTEVDVPGYNYKIDYSYISYQ